MSWREAEEASNARLREYAERIRATKREAPPLGCFVSKAWLQLIEELLRKGHTAQAMHMLAMQQTQPMRMPSFAEWPT
jgi:hypothetical protein